jgi:hypothetical protein
MNTSKLKAPVSLRQMLNCAILFLIIAASAGVAEGKDHKTHTSAAIKIIGTVSFEKAPADMVLQQVNGKSYLYVQLANAQEMAVVDITRPEKLRIVTTMPSSQATHLGISGNAATLGSSPGNQPVANSQLVLWDISDPGNPREVQRFSGVIRVLREQLHLGVESDRAVSHI